MKKSSRSKGSKKKPYSIFDYIIIIGSVVLVVGGLYYFFRGKSGSVKAHEKSVKAEPVHIKSENIQVPTQGQSRAIKSKKKSKKGTGPKKEKTNIISNEPNVEPVQSVDLITENELPVPITIIPVPRAPIQNIDPITEVVVQRDDVNYRPIAIPVSDTIQQENLNIDSGFDENDCDSSRSVVSDPEPESPVDTENNTNNEHVVENNNGNVLVVSEPNNAVLVPEPINGVELDSEDRLPAFFDTILEDKAEVLETLINQVLSNQLSINLNEVSSKNKYNALHFAAMNGKLECLRVIINHIKFFNFKIDDKSEDENINNALFLACYNANRFSEVAVDVVQLLLKNSPDVNIANSVDSNDYSLLFAAIEGSDAGVVSLLLEEWNADINYLLPTLNDSVLHIAMESCSRPVMKVIIDKGADLHAVNYYNREPIHEAAALGCVDGLRELILTQKIDKHHRSPRRDEEKENYDENCLFEATPLHFAAYFGQIDTIEFLFLIQADYHAKDQNEKNAAYYSESKLNTSITATVEVYWYFIDRLAWEKDEISEFKKIRQKEAEIRKLDSAPNPARLKTIKINFLHCKRKFEWTK